MADCIFCKIANGEIPSEKLYENEHVLAFADLSPKAPVHILVIPKRHIQSAAQLSEQDGPLLGQMFEAAAKVAEQQGLAQGYRLVINTGEHGGQTVPHLHIHILGGRQMEWPPG